MALWYNSAWVTLRNPSLSLVFSNFEDSFPELSCAQGRGTRNPLGIIDFQKSIKTNNFNSIGIIFL